MLRKFACLFAVLFIVNTLCSLVHSADQTVFGPENMEIGWWHVYASVHSFDVDNPGDGVIRVTKNTPEEDIRGGFLFLNTQFIPLRQFLIGEDIVLEKEVTLRSGNVLTVFLRGTPGASVSIEVITSEGTVLPPEVTFSGDPDSITLGGSSTLTWATTYAESASIDQGIGDVALGGVLNVSPTETTTYTISATGAGGTTTATVTVNVNDPSAPPIVSISADPATIAQGGSSTLSWTSLGAQSAHIDNGIGIVSISGSTIVSPTHTTTYTITVTGSTGSAGAQAVVKVSGNPESQPEGSFGEQYEDLIPHDATVEEYDFKRFSIITGLIQALDGAPIPDVSVTIHDHPEYGTVTTDAAGRFSIPVEGGGHITLIYKKDGFMTAHRKVYLPWNDIATTETIQMIAEDPASTTLTFDGSEETIITHVSTEVTDEFGTRSCTTVFTGDNLAYLMDEDGNDIHALTTITTRSTEYITPESMLAILPPTSAYTYCAELSVDGAQRVRFERPVTTWVDNFLGFAVGEVVPVGYYDRDRGVWVPSENGAVVKLLDTDTDGAVDALDADGDDQPDDLDSDGSFSNEVTGLADPDKYPPGSTLWRFQVTHFSAWDCNWPFGPPADAISPNSDGESSSDGETEDYGPCSNTINSQINHRSRIIHEDIPIPGTDISLHYAGNRVEGYKAHITVPASGGAVPQSLKRIIIKLEVAGVMQEQILEPLPDKKAEFVWDGLDYLGRHVKRSKTAKVSIGFAYDAVYYRVPTLYEAFGRGGLEPTTVGARLELIAWKNRHLFINREEGNLCEGWTFSPYHHFNIDDPATLHKGDGTILRNNSGVVTTLAGNGNDGFSGDGGPADEAALYFPSRVAVDAAGNIYIGDTYNQRIRKVDTDGIITTVAGNGGLGFSGDGGPATQAQLCNPRRVAVDSAGNLYIADTGNLRIRKVDTMGIITTVAGNGTQGWSGDGGPATEAGIRYPWGIAIDPEGNIYIATSGCRVRKVDTNGIITTIAGNGLSTPGYTGDGGPATEAQIGQAKGIALDLEGNLYIVAATFRIRKVDRSGTITTVAGNGTQGWSGDGGPATEAQLYYPYDVTVDTEGNIYILSYYGHHVRKVDTNGIITTVVGSGAEGFNGDGGPPTKASFNFPRGLTVDTAGNLYLADLNNHRVRKVSPSSTLAGAIDGGDTLFAEDTGTGHILSSAGVHKKTIDLDTGMAIYEFGHDADNNLESITDRFGRSVTISRDGGAPTSITSPDGLTTTLVMDGENHLTQVTYPDGSAHTFEYTPDGLMTAGIDPEGNRFEQYFNGIGRLTEAFDEEGGHWSYTRTPYADGDILTEMTTGEGNVTTYLDHSYSTNAFTSFITGPTGAETIYSRSGDGLTITKSLPCGMGLQFKYDLDPEYRFKYVKEARETTPSALERVTSRYKTYEDTNTDDVPDLITKTVTVNGNTTTLETNTLQSQKTITSPEGRSVTLTYDPATLLTTSLAIPGLHNTTYGYNTEGRLTSINTDERETTFTYNIQGFLASITDPEDSVTTYDHDPVGRITAVHRLDGSTIGFTYNGNGNITVLTNPSDIDHGFGYNRVNLNSSYHTPLSGDYSYIYDKDRRLIRTSFPSGRQINNIYDKTRLVQIRTPEGDIDLSYLCATKVGSITNGTDSISYGHDGPLVTSETLSGTLNTSLGYTYNNDFNIDSFTYAGDTEGYTYDNDGLLTSAGAFTITRNSANGLPEAVTGGALNLTRTFNGYGEVDAEDFNINGNSLASWDFTRDNAGRTTQKIETVDGVTSSYVYTYDPMGRLLTVTKDSALVEEYQYNTNGTRTYDMNVLRGIPGRTLAYSDEDHLLTAGTATYQYDPDGFLTTKTDGTDITSYTYSSRGELLIVTLPGNSLIEYIHDPLGRRIAKKVNGAVTEKYLWQGLTRLIAIYDGSNNLIMRFEYADGRMPVAMGKGGSTYYLTCDQVGSLRIVADSSGNVVKRVDYDSFGNIINDTDTGFEVAFGFAGGLHDRDTGLVRFGFRDYDPDIGRWTAKDPILFAGGDTDLYGYCLNDPVNWIDPEGLWKLSIQGYWGWGGGVTVGVNPNGLPFITGRVGYGFGGGVAFDPSGTSPGYDPCAPAGSVNVGGFAEVGAGIYTLSGSLSAEGGYIFTPGGENDHPFFSVRTQLGFSSSWKFGIGGGAGLEIGLGG